MLEAWCHTDIRSHGDTEHLIFLKTIFNEEKQGENLVNPRVTELLWELYSYIWSRDYVVSSNFLSHHNQSYHITGVSDRRIRSIICSCIHRKDEIKKRGVVTYRINKEFFTYCVVQSQLLSDVIRTLNFWKTLSLTVLYWFLTAEINKNMIKMNSLLSLSCFSFDLTIQKVFHYQT